MAASAADRGDGLRDRGPPKERHVDYVELGCSRSVVVENGAAYLIDELEVVTPVRRQCELLGLHGAPGDCRRGDRQGGRRPRRNRCGTRWTQAALARGEL